MESTINYTHDADLPSGKQPDLQQQANGCECCSQAMQTCSDGSLINVESATHLLQCHVYRTQDAAQRNAVVHGRHVCCCDDWLP